MLASVAVDSLLDKIQNELEGYTHRILTPTLVERSSCAPYHGRCPQTAKKQRPRRGAAFLCSFYRPSSFWTVGSTS